MSFLLDGILILICIIVLYSSVKRGFVHTILSVVAAVAAILVSIVFTPIVSEFLYENFILSSITAGILGTIGSLAGSGDSAGIVKMLEDMPEALSNIFTRYNVSDSTASSMLEGAKNGTETVDSISETIASPIASTISNVIAFAACFIVSIIVLKILICIIDNFFKLPVLKSANKAAGVLLGVALVIVVIFVYSESASRLVIALGAVSPDLFGKQAIDGTLIVKFFSEHNIFFMIEDVLEKNINF